MVKDPESIYVPGRRGLGWLKMKKALATIDCVVVGVEVGHGKRHGVLSDYTFAVRDTANDRLVNIGKAYSGLTDAEIAEMTRWFEAHTIARFGRYRQVEPAVVVEIAFDVIVRSQRHASGFALRFPRIVRIRDDKTPEEIDTVATVTALFEGLQHGSEYLVTAGARKAARRAIEMTRRTHGRVCSAMFSGIGGEARPTAITLVTDAFVVRGTIITRHRRITDMLNAADEDFLVLENATFDEFGSTGVVMQTDYAQVNLGAVLFGVADEHVDPTPELRVPKVTERALISIPPFTMTGHIHLMPERDLHQALGELAGPVHPGHRRHVLVGSGGGGSDKRSDRCGQPTPRPDPRPPPRDRPVGRSRPFRGRVGEPSGPAAARGPDNAGQTAGSGLAGGRPPQLITAT